MVSFNFITGIIAALLTTRDMNWGYLYKTRRKTILGGSAPAFMRATVLDSYPQLMSRTG